MKNQKEQIPVIGEFYEYLDREVFWRVDWLDEPFKGDQSRAMLLVHLSPLKPEWKSAVVTQPSSAYRDHQHWVKVGVGYLPLLYIGAVFKAGSPVYLGVERTLRARLDVSPRNWDFLRLDDAAFSSAVGIVNSRIVEPEHFAVGGAWRNAKASKVLALSDQHKIDPHYVTIPAIEVARFFFCPNSILARSLFMSGWDDLIYWPRCDSTQLPREVTVGLKQVKGLRYLDARHLAFVLSSVLTKEIVQGIPQFFQETNQEKKRKQEGFKCRFPFDEDAEITAEVVKIKTNTTLGVRYFVTRLLTVKRPIPFEICYAYPQLHPGQGENYDQADLKEAHIGGPKGGEKKEPLDKGRSQLLQNFEELFSDGLLSDSNGQPANSDQIARYSAPEDRFLDLMHVPTTLAPKSVQEYRNVGGKNPIPQDGKGLSTSSSRGSNPIAPADIDTNPGDGQSKDFPTEATTTDPYIKLLLESVPLLRKEHFTAYPLPLIKLARCAAAPKRGRTWSNIETGRDSEGTKQYRSSESPRVSWRLFS